MSERRHTQFCLSLNQTWGTERGCWGREENRRVKWITLFNIRWKEKRERKNEAKSQVFRAVIDSYPENTFHCRKVNFKWNQTHGIYIPTTKKNIWGIVRVRLESVLLLCIDLYFSLCWFVYVTISLVAVTNLLNVP